MRAGIDVNSLNDDDEPPLSRAIKYKKADAVCALFKAGADPAIKCSDGNVLHLIASSGIDLPCANQILSKIKNIDTKNESGEAPIHIAATQHTKTFNALLQAGASIDIRNIEGRTPLMLSVRTQMATNVAEALKRGAKPGIKDNEGNTALHISAMQNDYTITQMLINAGADVNERNEEGKTPIYYAAAHKDLLVLSALRKAGALTNSTEELLEQMRSNVSDSEDTFYLDTLRNILSFEPRQLPELPSISLQAYEGFWWYEGSIDKSQFKKGTCHIVSENPKTISTTSEFLEFTPYQVTRHTEDLYELNTIAKAYGNKVWINEQKFTLHKTGTMLALCSEDSKLCMVYHYAGKKLPDAWIQKNQVYDYEDEE